MRLTIYLVTSLTFILSAKSNAQSSSVSQPGDTAVLSYLLGKIGTHFFKKMDSALYYAERAYDEANKLGNYRAMVYALQLAGEVYRGKGNFPRSLEMQLTALRLNRMNEDKIGEAGTFTFIGFTFLQFGDYRRALQYLLPAYGVLSVAKDSIPRSFTASNLSHCYAKLNKIDSADFFNKESLRFFPNINDETNRRLALRTLINDRIGAAREIAGNLEEATLYYRTTLYYALQDNIVINISRSQKNLANIFMIQNKDDSAIFYARNAIVCSQEDGQILHTIEGANVLATIYKKQHKLDSALLYDSVVAVLKDSVFGVQKFSELQSLMLNEQEQQQKLLVEKSELRNRLRLTVVAVIAVALLGVAVILRRNNKAKQVINQQLQEQKGQLENTLKELRSTQSQLIQSEKMASLGELTAGIAHEIQNPLNFVNNFSDVNQDLISEMKNEMAKGKISEAEAIAENIRENEAKINHHGKRADAIVKGMMQHTRTSSGHKEPSDINALADEYLRLAFHGMRARDKSFNVELQTKLDPTISKINIVPEEIGRVLLNLYNNAFYAVSEKKKHVSDARLLQKESFGPDEQEFVPVVSVSTERSNGKVKITIKDNGNGIPEKIRDKIFQPFFTTKPTGQGTGLGLSLAYDIVTKGHGGELKVETKAGEGSEFIIQLPLIN